MSYFFESVLRRIPKNRSELVNELEIPEDIIKDRSYESTSSTQDWTEPEVSLTRSDSLFSETLDELLARPRPSTASTDSSIPLSRAMTDSEIDYGMFRRIRDRRLSDPWAELKARLDRFPPEYLASMESFITPSTETSDCRPPPPSPLRNEELRLKMERFFNEIQVFTPDDEGLVELEEAIRGVDLKSLDSDLDSLAA